VESWKNSSGIVGLSADFKDSLYVSDSPRSLTKRYYSEKAAVSEHVCPITCLCRKCQQLAAQGPSTGPPIPGVGRHGKPSHVDMESFCVNLSKPRDFAWLLSRVAEPNRRMSQTLGLNIPETVILEKGKPKKMYFLDGDGQLNMTRMKTSAELLRVLRNFIKLSLKREARALREADKSSAELAAKRRQSGGPSCVPKTKHTVVASNAFANDVIAENKLAVAGGEWDRLKAGAGPAEVAVLYYNDGAVRTMTALEAQQQMQGRSKLPKAFWGEIAMLQSTVQTSRKGSNTRYITYNFDLRSSDQKSALDDWHNRNAPNQQMTDGASTTAVEAVPKMINDYLKKKVNLEMVSGQLDFMLDEADDTLWLVNASRLICAKTALKIREDSKDPVQTDIKYFCEEAFSQSMEAHEQYVNQLQDAFDKEKKRIEQANAMRGERELIRSGTTTLNEPTMQLPPTLQTLNDMQAQMTKYYKEKVKYEFGQRPSRDFRDKFDTGTHNIPLLFETSLGDLKRTFSGSSLGLPSRSAAEVQQTGSRVTSAGQRSELRICRVPEKPRERAPPPRLSRPQSASSQAQSQSDTALLGEDLDPPLSSRESRQGSRPGSRPPSRQTSRPPSHQMKTRPLRSQSEAFPAAQYITNSDL